MSNILTFPSEKFDTKIKEEVYRKSKEILAKKEIEADIEEILFPFVEHIGEMGCNIASEDFVKRVAFSMRILQSAVHNLVEIHDENEEWYAKKTEEFFDKIEEKYLST